MNSKPPVRKKAARKSESDADGSTSIIETKAFVETPSVVHGRLLEAVNMTGYTLERATGELDWLLDEDRWRTVGSFEHINDFLGTIDLSTFAIIKERRKGIAKKIEKAGGSQRATANVLGVDPETVRRDLKEASAANAAPEKTDTAENKDLQTIGAAFAAPETANGPKPWFQREADPTKPAKNAEKQEKKTAARKALAAELTAKNAPLPISQRKYAAICPDVPWFFKVGSDKGKDRSVENHYPTMSIDEINALPVAELAADDCVLFLWVTMPCLEMARDVIKAWGFEYKTCAFVWIKTTTGGEDEPEPIDGMGYWTRSNAELCLLATRGKPMRMNADVGQVVMTPRLAHSEKPDEVYDRIRRLVSGPYLELFARKAREGWDAWGNEAEAAPADLPPNWDGHGYKSEAPTPEDDFPDIPPSLRRVV